ncbi:MAG: hypothetical protein LUH63_06405 [Parabacteroides sp.]|nr:hypothetical protein [Parabacteroides sp.]
MCSDSKSRYFTDIDQTSSNWVNTANSDGAKQGPCPAGYKLASAPQLENLFTTTEAYTGFVYDDDYPAGGDENDLPYGYTMTPGVGHRIVSGTGNHCNPAKGAIVVPKNDTKGQNIFFTFGKGTISLSKIQQRDPNLIAEIGIGHRGINGSYDNGGYLKFYEFLNSDNGHITEHTYGAFYWGGTRFSGDKFSRVCFFYDILTRSPYYADTRGGEHNTDKYGKPQPDTGIDAANHGSFVRCVRNK